MAMNEIDAPLYTESKLTRQQAMNEITDVIFRSDMKPQIAECTLQLLQKLLPVNNTLPTTIDELFRAMMSTENDWRLAQYLIKHNRNSSFLPSSTNTSVFSSSDEESELSPYDRLQQCLRPIMNIPTNANLNHVRSLDEQRSESSMNSSPTLRPSKRFRSETSSPATSQEQNQSYLRRILARFEDDAEDEHDDSCCFEINGYNLLNGGKRRRYN